MEPCRISIINNITGRRKSLESLQRDKNQLPQGCPEHVLALFWVGVVWGSMISISQSRHNLGGAGNTEGIPNCLEDLCGPPMFLAVTIGDDLDKMSHGQSSLDEAR